MIDRLPFPPSGELFTPPPRYRELQETAPVVPVTTSTGDPAWLVARHADVAALLGDERLGRSHPEPERAARVSTSVLLGGPVGDHATERERHRRMRRLLGPAFSARRISLPQPRVAQLVDRLIDALPAPPADWHRAFSVPLPVLVICELLGVPVDDQDLFRGWAQDMTDLTAPDSAMAARQMLVAYTHRLIVAKRVDPGEDVISDLIAAQAEFALTDQDIAGTAAMLLFAGHETTVVRLDLGLVLLLTHREYFDALSADPDTTPTVVEEILRLSSLSSAVGGLPRYAHEEIRLGEVTISTGDAVILAPHAANRDPRVFPDPDVFDPIRAPNPHLAFGHGSHYCIGASLARLELTEALVRIAARLPELKIAVAADTLRLRDNHLTGGLAELPVAW
ncbi:cytochrome P450 [Catenulispora sp. GAS73]|uniref:cytochrome P450 n=1 Tax=Catenulispora sp. GAS73 TaxID=3156269 RepID=UPI00351272B7